MIHVRESSTISLTPRDKTMPPTETHSRPSLSRDFIILSVAILFVLALASLWVAYVSYEEHSDKTINLLENEAVRIDRSLIVEIKNASYLLESLGRQISQYGGDKQDQTSRLLRSFNDDAGKDNIFVWVDAMQRATVSSNRGILAKPIDISDRDYVKKALADPWKVQIGRPVLGRVSEKWVLPVAMGLTDFDGRHLGIIVISLDINTMTNEIQRDLHNPGVRFAILSKTLTPLTGAGAQGTKDNHILPTEALTDTDFEKHHSGILSRASLFAQHKGYALYEVSSKYPYVILIGYDGDLGAVEVMELMLPKLTVVIFNALVLLTLLWMVRQRVIQPVDSLTSSVGNIVRGEEFLPLKGAVPAEIDQLAEQIRKLSQYLRERERVEEELLIKNTYLRRVKETTQLMNKARTKFLMTLSEELEKPVLSIAEYAEGMKDQHFGPLKNEAYIRHAFDIYRLSMELKQMVIDVMAVSHMESGVIILYEKPTNIAFCLHRAVRHFQDHPQYKHMEVKLRMDENLPKLLIDEERFNTILLNLLTRTATHLSPGSAIVLEASVEKTPAGAAECLIMMKYTMLHQHHEQDIEQIRRLQFISEGGKNQQPVVSSEGINLALTQMLVSLHQGTLTIDVSTNHVCRIFIRFPETRIVHTKSDDNHKTTMPEKVRKAS